MFQWFLPKEVCFFTFFNEHAALTHQAALELTEGRDRDKIKGLEHAADHITRKCKEALHRIFITPIDRDSIFTLISTMDDIIDCIYTISNRYALYKIETTTSHFNSQVHILCQAVEHVEQAVKSLSQIKNSEPIIKHCSEIIALEHTADRILNTALADLFDNATTDFCLVIKWKELYELTEDAIDLCEDVANIIEGIVLEYA